MKRTRAKPKIKLGKCVEKDITYRLNNNYELYQLWYYYHELCNSINIYYHSNSDIRDSLDDFFHFGFKNWRDWK